MKGGEKGSLNGLHIRLSWKLFWFRTLKHPKPRLVCRVYSAFVRCLLRVCVVLMYLELCAKCSSLALGEPLQLQQQQPSSPAVAPAPSQKANPGSTSTIPCPPPFTLCYCARATLRMRDLHAFCLHFQLPLSIYHRSCSPVPLHCCCCCCHGPVNLLLLLFACEL